jgi:hypothetical protein
VSRFIIDGNLPENVPDSGIVTYQDECAAQNPVWYVQEEHYFSKDAGFIPEQNFGSDKNNGRKNLNHTLPRPVMIVRSKIPQTITRSTTFIWIDNDQSIEVFRCTAIHSPAALRQPISNRS